MRFDNRRQLAGDAAVHAQSDRLADTFPRTVTESLTKPIPDRVAVAKSCARMFPAAGRDFIQGDDHRRSRGLASGL
jgi:hypothetical protein